MAHLRDVPVRFRPTRRFQQGQRRGCPDLLRRRPLPGPRRPPKGTGGAVHNPRPQGGLGKQTGPIRRMGPQLVPQTTPRRNPKNRPGRIWHTRDVLTTLPH